MSSHRLPLTRLILRGPLDLSDVDRLLAGLTEDGKWAVFHVGGARYTVTPVVRGTLTHADAELIARAPTLLRELRAYIRRVERGLLGDFEEPHAALATPSTTATSPATVPRVKTVPWFTTVLGTLWDARLGPRVRARVERLGPERFEARVFFRPGKQHREVEVVLPVKRNRTLAQRAASRLGYDYRPAAATDVLRFVMRAWPSLYTRTAGLEAVFLTNDLAWEWLDGALIPTRYRPTVGMGDHGDPVTARPDDPPRHAFAPFPTETPPVGRVPRNVRRDWLDFAYETLCLVLHRHADTPEKDANQRVARGYLRTVLRRYEETGHPVLALPWVPPR